LAAAPVLAYFLLQSRFQEALGLALLAGLTDWLDGFLARKLHVSGKMGVVLDPIADKTLLVTLFLTLGYIRLVPRWVVALVIGRDVMIVVGALLLRAFRHVRQFVPSPLGKVSTFFQIVLVLLVLLELCFKTETLSWLEKAALFGAVFFTTASGADYVRRGVLMSKRAPGKG
jgi:cardiolipin synthase